MSKPSLEQIRHDYARASLDLADVSPDPIEQLTRWMNEALAAEVTEPTAITLATATKDGVPSARIVLCKGISADGITFFTNYESEKGRELEENPRAAALFFWPALERQVRLVGAVTKVTKEESAAYFQTRPKASRISTLVSAQSRPVASREVLEKAFAEAATTYEQKDPPLPDFWGGYRLAPDVFEFWQGRRSRLHDRLHYTRDGQSFRIARLAP